MIRSAFILFVLSVISGVAQDAAKTDPAAASRLRDQTGKVFAKWDSTVSPGCALSVMQDELIDHFHTERNHQGTEQRPPVSL